MLIFNIYSDFYIRRFYRLLKVKFDNNLVNDLNDVKSLKNSSLDSIWFDVNIVPILENFIEYLLEKKEKFKDMKVSDICIKTKSLIEAAKEEEPFEGLPRGLNNGFAELRRSLALNNIEKS